MKLTHTERTWLDIAIKCSNFDSEEEDLQSEDSPKNNFSGNGKKLDTKSDAGGELTWLDRNREAGE